MEGAEGSYTGVGMHSPPAARAARSAALTTACAKLSAVHPHSSLLGGVSRYATPRKMPSNRMYASQNHTPPPPPSQFTFRFMSLQLTREGEETAGRAR